MLPVLRNSFNWPSLLNDFFGRDLATESVFPKGFSMPAVNVAEFGDKYLIEVAAPGLSRDDFKLSVQNNVLTISSEKEEKKEDNDKKFHRREFSYLSFQRSFALPEHIDVGKITASHTDGILKIEIPKREEAKEKPSRTIQIS